MKRLVGRLEVLAESVGTVAGAQSWRQRVPDFRRCKRSYERIVLFVHAKRMVSRLVLDKEQEFEIEFCTGAGAVKSRGKPREYRGSGKNDHPSSRGSVGSGTDCCGNPAGPGVKGVLLPREWESPPVS